MMQEYDPSTLLNSSGNVPAPMPTGSRFQGDDWLMSALGKAGPSPLAGSPFATPAPAMPTPPFLGPPKDMLVTKFIGIPHQIGFQLALECPHEAGIRPFNVVFTKPSTSSPMYHEGSGIHVGLGIEQLAYYCSKEGVNNTVVNREAIVTPRDLFKAFSCVGLSSNTTGVNQSLMGLDYATYFRPDSYRIEAFGSGFQIRNYWGTGYRPNASLYFIVDFANSKVPDASTKPKSTITLNRDMREFPSVGYQDSKNTVSYRPSGAMMVSDLFHFYSFASGKYTSPKEAFDAKALINPDNARPFTDYAVAIHIGNASLGRPGEFSDQGYCIQNIRQVNLLPEAEPQDSGLITIDLSRKKRWEQLGPQIP